MRPLFLVPVFVAASAAWGASSPRVAAPDDAFDDLARRAAQAWQEGRLPEAATLYADAVKLRPDWDEGWWYRGTALYSSRRWEEARAAFQRFLELKPEAGAGWALSGLCEFEMGERAAADTSLAKALALATTLNPDLRRAVQFHRALLLIKDGRFELALEPLSWLAGEEPETPGLEVAIGLDFLRMTLLPSEVPEDRRDLVAKTGRAGFLGLATREGEAKAAYAELVEAYPDEPWVHYARGAFLKKLDSKQALVEFRRELEVLPTNVYARLEIAFALLARGDYEGAREAAKTATQLAPELFAARHALGRALVGLGRLDEGIPELEEAARLAPDVPEMQFALERAYTLAGRSQDAAAARARLTELVGREAGSAEPSVESEVRQP